MRVKCLDLFLYLEDVNRFSVLKFRLEGFQRKLVGVIIPLAPDVAALQDDTVAVVWVVDGVHVEGNPDLRVKICGHADIPLSWSQRTQWKVLFRNNSKLSFHQGCKH